MGAVDAGGDAEGGSVTEDDVAGVHKGSVDEAAESAATVGWGADTNVGLPSLGGVTTSSGAVACGASTDAAAADNRNNPCPYCPARYARKGNLLQHVAHNHSEDMDVASTSCPETPFGAAALPFPLLRRGGGTPASGARETLSHGRRNADQDVGCGGGAAAEGLGVLPGAANTPDGAAFPEINTTSQKVREYYAAFGDVARTQPLVDERHRDRPSDFVSDELKEMRMFALSAGGRGLSQKARAEYYTTCVSAERAALRSQQADELAPIEKVMALLSQHETDDDSDATATAPPHAEDVPRSDTGDPDAPSFGGGVRSDPLGAASAMPSAARPGGAAGGATLPGSRPRPRKKTSLRRRVQAVLAEATAKLKDVIGPLETAFPSASAFVNSLQGEATRCLAEQQWRKTEIVDGKDVYVFYSRDVMAVALAAFTRATKRCMRGHRKYAADGSVMRTGTLDGDIYLREQADVDSIHGGKMHDGKELPVFTMATQLFSDATLVSKNGGKRRRARFCFARSLICGGVMFRRYRARLFKV